MYPLITTKLDKQKLYQMRKHKTGCLYILVFKIIIGGRYYLTLAALFAHADAVWSEAGKFLK